MKFGQYELLERVAVGGMAEVYRGRVAGAEGFEKWVAIKRILPEYARDERFISMMLTEARIHSALSHPNIVQIHDLGISEDGEYFIVLEYVEGHDLRAVMEAAAELGVQIPDSLALHVADVLAQALHFAHELKDPEGQPLGIIHRDVSPSNVLISNSGEVKLSDFGIAKRRHDHSFVGSLKGNLVYMSPEQARRVPLDRRADVFSLGAVLFEMLTGHKVREITDDVSGFRDVASGLVRSARALRPDLPEAYEQLLLRALASNPADRFQDAAAFGAAIRELGREHDAPVGPADMKELVELLNPPRRARSPVERSKVIRLGPEFKALADHGRGSKPTSTPTAVEAAPVILAPAPLPLESLISPSNGKGGASRHWAGDAGERLAAATPAPIGKAPEARQILKNAAAPPPPLPSGPASVSRTGARAGRLSAADAAVHALEFSAGSDMQPTPPPPAVQGPYAPDVVTPIAARIGVAPPPASPRLPRLPEERPTNATPLPVAVDHGRMPAARPASTGLRIVATTPAPHDVHELGASVPTPPPRAATYPGLGSGPRLSSPISGAHRSLASNLGTSRTDAPIFQTFPPQSSPTLSVTARRPRTWASVVVLVLVVVSAAAAVVHYKFVPLEVLAVWLKPATLAIASDPSGADVVLDGRALPDRTPMSVDVHRDRLDHVLEFARPGSIPARLVIRFDRTVALVETVNLAPEPARPPPPEPASPPTPSPAPAPVAVAPTESHLPQTKAEKRVARKVATASARNSGTKQLARRKAKKKGKKTHKKGPNLDTTEL
jgi:serine/threonine protein kinase